MKTATDTNGKRPRCEKCGFRIRGTSHEQGQHHIQGGDAQHGSKRHATP